MVGFSSYSLKVTPLSSVVIGEVALSQFVPLSVDLTMFPPEPTPTKVLFPKVTPRILVVIGEVALSQDDPLSVDLRIFPPEPTAMNNPETEEEGEWEVVNDDSYSLLRLFSKADFAPVVTLIL